MDLELFFYRYGEGLIMVPIMIILLIIAFWIIPGSFWIWVTKTTFKFITWFIGA